VEPEQSARELRSLSEKKDKLSQPEALFLHALINYCVNILGKTHFEAQGGDLRSHLVLGQLLEINRTPRSFLRGRTPEESSYRGETKTTTESDRLRLSVSECDR